MTKKHFQGLYDRSVPEVSEQEYIIVPIPSGLSVPEEMFDFLKILESGAKKHGQDTWLQPEYKRNWSDHAFHHAAKAFVNPGSVDKESGLDHDLHAAINHLMRYVRNKRGLK